MNIPSVKADGIVPAAKAKAPPAKTSPATAAGDVFKPEQNEKLMNLLRSEPDARPEVVERARALVADASYPPADVLERVAREILSRTLR